MARSNFKEFEKLQTPFLSSAAFKKHLLEMLEKSSQCKAILENINDETGEYCIVLQGVLEKN